MWFPKNEINCFSEEFREKNEQKEDHLDYIKNKAESIIGKSVILN